MEVFGEIWYLVKVIYYYYFMSIYGIFNLFLPVKYSLFISVLVANFIPVAFLLKDIVGMGFFEMFYRHYGLWLYSLLMTWLWLTITKEVDLSLVDEKGLRALGGATVITLATIWGPLQLRGKIYTIKRGIETSNQDR